MVKDLNTTGSLWLDNNGNIYSYSTQLTGNYKGLRVFNNTYYSMTTRKHQAQFDKNSFDIILNCCRYKTRLQPNEIETAIKEEIKILDYNLSVLKYKNPTSKNAETILNINNHKNKLIAALNK